MVSSKSNILSYSARNSFSIEYWIINSITSKIIHTRDIVQELIAQSIIRCWDCLANETITWHVACIADCDLKY